MHPAISVIFFTVMSGAGFGLIGTIGLGVPMPQHSALVFLACLLAGGLAVAGLLSSTFHLGHPERAWRAFSQWRSSWLSREGVAAVFTLVAFGLYAFSWFFFGERISWLGYLMALGALVTVFTTAMIYTQLKTVPAWNTVLTPVCYLLFALSSGVLLAASFGEWQAQGEMPIAAMALAYITFAWVAKLYWWRNADRDTLAARGSDTGTATGLGTIGSVRLLEKPHSGENYLTKEMVHIIGRKHATKLRMIALILGAILPLVLCIIALAIGSATFLMAIAFLCMLAGLFVERWLFFAEAKHAVSLYY